MVSELPCERCKCIPTSDGHKAACDAYWDAIDAIHRAEDAREQAFEYARTLQAAYAESTRPVTLDERIAQMNPVSR